MIVLAYYLLKVIICSAVLFGYYWLALRNKIFHQYNRFYLLAAVVLSLLLPVIKINFWDNSVAAKPAVIKVLQAVSDGDVYLNNIIVSDQSPQWTLTDWAGIVYFATSLVMLLVLFQTLFVIYRLLKKYPRQQIGDISLVNTDAKSTPFSFLRFIFWNRNIDAESVTGKQIFKHEVAHIQEKHSYDKLFMNLVLTVFWCNPVFWLLRRELNMIHEFIADKKAVEDSDTASFAAMILQAAYPQHQFSLANNFFYSPIKRRLAMLMKNNHTKVSYWGRVLILPVAVLLFAAFTFKAKDKNPHFYKGEKIKVVIDAGHGGKYPGAKAGDGTLEKDITLAIAKEIRELNTNSDIEIVLTKSDDIFLTKEEKTAFVKQNHADMYISIHTGYGAEQEISNNMPPGNSIPASGLSIWVPETSAPIASESSLFGSAILGEFIHNYGLPVQQELHQRNLYTFVNNPCPSLYIETAVLANTADLKYVRSAEGKTTIAKNILAGIEKYAAASLQAGNTRPIAQTAFPVTMVNMKHSDTNYLKSSDYKTRALIILDDKEIGNFGAGYLEKNNIRYNSIVVYSPAEAMQKFGEKGKYGVIKITQNTITVLKADSVFVNDKTKEIKLTGSNTKIDGDFSDALIYIDGKEATAKQLKEVNGSKIASVNIVKGEKLDEVANARGKKSVIYVSLKPEPLQEVVVEGYSLQPQQASQGTTAGSQAKEYVTKLENLQEVVVDGYQIQPRPHPLYVIDGKEQPANFNLNSINANDIERIDVLKDKTATERYGEKGKNGVIMITTKSKNDKLAEVVVEGYRTVKDAQLQTVPDGKSNRLPAEKEWAEAAGTSDPLQKSDDKIFLRTEQEASFTGGMEAWKKYLEKNLDASIPRQEGWTPGTYTIITEFVVRTDGSVTDVHALNRGNSKTAQHCISLIKNSGKWNPAVQNGRPVNSYRKQPITFVITGKEITGVYNIPLKVHLMNGSEINTYNMVSNGNIAADGKTTVYLDGKLSFDLSGIKKEDIRYIETYDAAAAQKLLGKKYSTAVTFIKTKV